MLRHRSPLLMWLCSLAALAWACPAIAADDQIPTDLYGDALPTGAIMRLGSIRFRHGSNVNAVAFSPDGKNLASGSWDKTIHLKTAKDYYIITGHSEAISALAFSQDSKTLASGSHDETVRLWDVATGKEIRCIREDDTVRFLCFSPDGKYLAVGTAYHEKETVRVWEAATGKKMRSQAGHSPVFTPDGNMIYCRPPGRKRRAAKFYWVVSQDINSGKETHLFDVDSETNHIILSCDGKTLASKGLTFERLPPKQRTQANRLASMHQTIQLWDLATGMRTHDLAAGKDLGCCLAISPDGKTLVSTDKDHLVQWDTSTGKETCRWHAHNYCICLSFSPDGKTLASGSSNTVQLWEAATGKEILPALIGHQGGVTSLSVSAMGDILATASSDRTIRIWDLKTGKQTHQWEGSAGVALSPDGKRFASGSLRDVQTGKVIHKLDPRVSANLAFSPDGKGLASGGHSISFELWNTATGECERTFCDTLGHINSLVFAPDGKTIASGSQNVQLYDLAKGYGPVLLHGKMFVRWTVAYSPDGKKLAAASKSGQIIVWDTAKWDDTQNMSVKSYVEKLAFSRDGKILACCVGNQVHLLDTASGKELGRVEGHTRRLWDVAFLPDGKRLATASDDCTVLIWDLKAVLKER